MVIQTKKILREGEMVVINACDFDPMVHEEWKSEAERLKAQEAERLKKEGEKIIADALKGNKK